MMTINRWAVCSSSNNGPFTPPECQSKSLQGYIDTHPVLGKCGEKSIVTSRIVKVEGRIVTTSSGSKYLLGTVNPKYVEWCAENKVKYSEAEPIRFING